MTDLIFDLCYLTVIISVFALLFGITEKVFDFAGKHIPAFDTWVNNFIGIDDDDESEVD